MSLHVLNTAVQVDEHFCKVLIPDIVACAWGVESPGDRFQICVKLHVLSNVLCQLIDSFCLSHKTFALASKACCLYINGFK